MARLRLRVSWPRPSGEENAILKIDPFVGLFVAIAALNASMFVRLRAAIAEIRENISGNSERLAQVEAGLAAPGDRLSATNERPARVGSTVAGAFGRPFPQRMARTPGAEDSPGG